MIAFLDYVSKIDKKQPPTHHMIRVSNLKRLIVGCFLIPSIKETDVINFRYAQLNLVPSF